MKIYIPSLGATALSLALHVGLFAGAAALSGCTPAEQQLAVDAGQVALPIAESTFPEIAVACDAAGFVQDYTSDMSKIGEAARLVVATCNPAERAKVAGDPTTAGFIQAQAAIVATAKAPPPAQ